VAPSPSYILAPSEFLNDDFLRPKLIDDGSDDAGPLDLRGTDDWPGRITSNQQDLRENDLIACLPRATVDPNVVPFTNPELVATILDDRVHPSSSPREDQGVQVTTASHGPTLDRPHPSQLIQPGASVSQSI
jgi:hypothetical protein